MVFSYANVNNLLFICIVLGPTRYIKPTIKYYQYKNKSSRRQQRFHFLILSHKHHKAKPKTKLSDDLASPTSTFLMVHVVFVLYYLIYLLLISYKKNHIYPMFFSVRLNQFDFNIENGYLSRRWRNMQISLYLY